MEYIIVALGAYLFGSIPWALIIGKVFYHTDIRTQGSGNLGGTNAGRVLGKKAGVSVTILDGLKAFFVVMFCYFLAPNTCIIGGLACCVGHCFPIFANFRGGKAVATTMGYFLAVSLFITHHIFWQFIFLVICFFVILYLCKMVSVSSILTIFIGVIISFIIQDDLSLSLSFLILWIFVTYRHKENIKRVLNHEEKKITWM